MYEMKAININELTKILSNLFGNPNESSWIGDESLPEKSIFNKSFSSKYPFQHWGNML